MCANPKANPMGQPHKPCNILEPESQSPSPTSRPRLSPCPGPRPHLRTCPVLPPNLGLALDLTLALILGLALIR